jgi:membrane protease YdiL (CAAX protease family)
MSSTATDRRADARTAALLPVALPLARVVLVGLSALAVWALLSTSGEPIGYSAVTQYSALALAPVNLLCLYLLSRVLCRDGGSIRQLAGLTRARLGRDIAWGLLWLAVLYLPFALAVVGTMLVLFGGDAFTSFERVFAPDPSAGPLLPQAVAIVLAVLTVVTFAPLNAPTEELVFRGYSQGRLARVWPASLAVLVPAVIFGLQHALFAPSVEGAIVYVVAFFVWGLGSGLIYLRQRRLAPLVYCHLIVNLLFSLPALVVPFVAGA